MIGLLLALFSSDVGEVLYQDTCCDSPYVYIDTCGKFIGAIIDADSFGNHDSSYFLIDSVRFNSYGDDTFRIYTGHGIFKWKITAIDTAGYALRFNMLDGWGINSEEQDPYLYRSIEVDTTDLKDYFYTETEVNDSLATYLRSNTPDTANEDITFDKKIYMGVQQKFFWEYDSTANELYLKANF